MGNKRRKDKDHDIGDSMPGTVGDSRGTIHDGQGIPSFDPEDVAVPEENTTINNTENEAPNESQEAQQDTGKSTRREYAEKYGESWPEKRQRRFLREHDVSAKEMGWKLTE